MKIILIIILIIAIVALIVRKLIDYILNKIKDLYFEGGTCDDCDDWYDEEYDAGIDGIKDFKNK